MITVVFCLPGKSFSYRFLNSWSSLLSHCPMFNINPLLRLAHSNNIYLVRNACLMENKIGKADQKPFEGKIQYDYIMWIDSDNVFTAHQFKQLLEKMESNNKTQILAGLYLAEDRERYLAHYLPNGKFTKKFNSEFIKPPHLQHLPKKPIRVLFSGMGFMLVKKGVFESIRYPWFEPQVAKHSSGQSTIIGDDASFCVKASKVGISTYIDPSIIVGHEKPVVLI